MGAPQVAPVRDLLLVGGGHAHVQVLRQFGMQPVPGVRLTVVARESHTPYSGMLPGYVAGQYEFDDIHIDLGPLARFAGARLLADSVIGLDLEQRTVQLRGHPDLRFDAVSINIGATPRAVTDASTVTTVKPIGRFLPKWRACRAALAPKDRILLLGAGAGAVELALAMRTAVPSSVGVGLVGATLLPGWPERARARMRAVLAQQKIGLLESQQVVAVDGSTVSTDGGQQLVAEHIFDVTGVQAPEWIKQTGLLLDERGFVRVDGHLRSLSHPHVFAAGDIAALEGQPRPKSGVFAVRAGPILATNLARLWGTEPLLRYRAQAQALALLGTGNGQALAVRGALVGHGRWAARLKQRIDQRFMQRFVDLPVMATATPLTDLRAEVAADIPDPMRCGGCGGKLAAEPLARVLARLPVQTHPDLTLGIGDDAASLRLAADSGRELLLTVDGLSQFIDDPYRFGRIATQHAVNDVLAMGGRPVAALALATMPLMSQALLEQDLYLLLKGVVEVLAEHDAVLAGGHSAEGPQLALGLTVAGYPGKQTLSKSGAQPGEHLILTKALGTGVLLAGDMRGQTPSRHLQCALQVMDQSNAAAVSVFGAHAASAATDITGFGLLGHLTEMLAGAKLGVTVDLAQLPALAGATALLQRQVFSSLQSANRQVLGRFVVRTELADPIPANHAHAASLQTVLELACDPQTSGGLLASVPAAQATGCVAALRAAGYTDAADIGVVEQHSSWTLRYDSIPI